MHGARGIGIARRQRYEELVRTRHDECAALDCGQEPALATLPVWRTLFDECRQAFFRIF